MKFRPHLLVGSVWKASWVSLYHKKTFFLYLVVENHKVKQPGSRSHSWSVAQPAAQTGFPDSSSPLWCHVTFLCHCPWNPSANFHKKKKLKSSPTWAETVIPEGRVNQNTTHRGTADALYLSLYLFSSWSCHFHLSAQNPGLLLKNLGQLGKTSAENYSGDGVWGW